MAEREGDEANDRYAAFQERFRCANGMLQSVTVKKGMEGYMRPLFLLLWFADGLTTYNRTLSGLPFRRRATFDRKVLVMPRFQSKYTM